MAGYVQGVTGLTNIIRERSGAERVDQVAPPAGSANNGLFPVTPGYGEATGIGTPKMGALMTLSSF